DLWDAVKQRQVEVMLGPQGTKTKPWDRRRPRYLLSGLVKCGACGGGYVQISKTHLGCATARNKGTCQNRLGIGRGEAASDASGSVQGILCRIHQGSEPIEERPGRPAVRTRSRAGARSAPDRQAR